MPIKNQVFDFFKTLFNGGQNILKEFGPRVARGALEGILDHLQMGDSINRAYNHPMTKLLNPKVGKPGSIEEDFVILDSRAPAYVGYQVRDTEGTFKGELDSFAQPKRPLKNFQPVPEVIDSGGYKIERGRAKPIRNNLVHTAKLTKRERRELEREKRRAAQLARGPPPKKKQLTFKPAY